MLAEGDGFVVLAEAACDFALVAAGVAGVAGVAGGDTVAPTAGEGSPWAAPAAELRALTSSGTVSGAVRSGVGADTPLEVFESVGAFSAGHSRSVRRWCWGCGRNVLLARSMFLARLSRFGRRVWFLCLLRRIFGRAVRNLAASSSMGKAASRPYFWRPSSTRSRPWMRDATPADETAARHCCRV